MANTPSASLLVMVFLGTVCLSDAFFSDFFRPKRKLADVGPVASPAIDMLRTDVDFSESFRPDGELHSSMRKVTRGGESGYKEAASGVTTKVDKKGRTVHRRHVVYEWYDGKWHEVIVDGPAPNQPEDITSKRSKKKDVRSKKPKGKKGKAGKKPKSKSNDKKSKKSSKKRTKPSKLKKSPTGKNGKTKNNNKKKPNKKGNKGVKKNLPTTCNCVKENSGAGVCYFYTDNNSNYCAHRYCAPQYVCVGGKRFTGLTCIRRKITSKVVPVGKNTCKTVKERSYMYVPYYSF